MIPWGEPRGRQILNLAIVRVLLRRGHKSPSREPACKNWVFWRSCTRRNGRVYDTHMEHTSVLARDLVEAMSLYGCSNSGNAGSHIRPRHGGARSESESVIPSSPSPSPGFPKARRRQMATQSLTYQPACVCTAQVQVPRGMCWGGGGVDTGDCLYHINLSSFTATSITTSNTCWLQSSMCKHHFFVVASAFRSEDATRTVPPATETAWRFATNRGPMLHPINYGRGCNRAGGNWGN